jgi:hypothetical protein
MEGDGKKMPLKTNMESILKWTARIASIFVILMVLVMFIGEGGFNPFKLTTTELIMMIFFWGTVAGLAVAWRWQLTGGLISIACMMAFYAIEKIATGGFPRGWAFMVVVSPAIIFLVSHFLSIRKKSKSE